MKKEEYYEQKEKLLSVISPTCIHKEFCGYERRRIYDFESEYDSYDGEFVYENSYWDSDEERRVHFGDVELIDEPVFKYYLFYDLGCHTFHTPLDESMANAYSDLSVIIIDHLITEGKEIAELLSAQFMKKVISLIDSGEYRLKEI